MKLIRITHTVKFSLNDDRPISRFINRFLNGRQASDDHYREALTILMPDLIDAISPPIINGVAWEYAKLKTVIFNTATMYEIKLVTELFSVESESLSPYPHKFYGFKVDEKTGERTMFSIDWSNEATGYYSPTPLEGS